MGREELSEKYFKLSEEFENTYNAMIKGMKEKANQQIEAAIQKDLNAMEIALKNGTLGEAAYHKMKAEILFGSLFR